MKRQILLMGIALLLNAATDVQAQSSPSRLRRAADKQRKELKMQHAPLHRVAPLAAQRIQPSTSELYSGIDTTPTEYYKYDAWGNKTEEQHGSNYLVQTWDNSHGYPVLLDKYYHSEPKGGTADAPVYSQRTTLNASGVRTAVESEDYDHITLDAAGHVTATDWAETYDETSESEYNRMTWDGDRLTSYKNKFIYDGTNSEHPDGYHSEATYELNDIQIVHAAKPFNAYGLDYEDFAFFDYDYGDYRIVFSGVGTYSYRGPEGDEDIDVRINSEVSADGKNITMTVTYNGELAESNVIKILDDNGSYTSRWRSPMDDDEGHEITEMFNEYGDCISELYKGYIGDVQKREDRFLYVWEYENNRPVKVTASYGTWSEGQPEPEEIEMNQENVEVFTAWHDGSSITATEATEPRILGATLYTPDGKKVRTLTAEEAQAADRLTAPQRGIYLLVTQTDRGVETRKVIK